MNGLRLWSIPILFCCLARVYRNFTNTIFRSGVMKIHYEGFVRSFRNSEHVINSPLTRTM